MNHNISPSGALEARPRRYYLSSGIRYQVSGIRYQVTGLKALYETISADGKALTFTSKDAQGKPTGDVQVFDKQTTS
jgi:hypothetical protein